MNSITLRGYVSGHPYFDVLGARRQPFLRFYLHVPGPAAEGESAIRIVAYGRWVEPLYPDLHPGIWVAVTGRLRRRENLDALPAARAKFIAHLQKVAGLPEPALVAEGLVHAIGDKLTPVYEVVAFYHQIQIEREANADDGEAVETCVTS